MVPFTDNRALSLFFYSFIFLEMFPSTFVCSALLLTLLIVCARYTIMVLFLTLLVVIFFAMLF